MKKGTKWTKQQHNEIGQFIKQTKSPQNVAVQFLTKSKWVLKEAIISYNEEQKKGGKDKQNPQLEQLFKKISTNGVIEQEGFIKLIEEYLKIDFENTVIGHILTNIMKIPKSSVNAIPKQCLYHLYQYCNAKSIKDVVKAIPKLQKQHKEPKLYKEMYFKLYDIYLVNNIMTLDFQIGHALWMLYLKPIFVFYDKFMEFLEGLGEKKPNKIHRDLWKMVFEFANSIKKIQDHNADDLWPGLLDDFVQFLKLGK